MSADPKDNDIVPDLPITNCHTHTFTTAHAPLYFPHRALALVRWFPWLVRFLRFVAGVLPWQAAYDFLVRMENFHRTGNRRTQEEIFREILHFYPLTTRFVVLPMDMKLIGHGPVQEDIYGQHDALAKLARDFPDRVVPFGTVFPDRPDGAFEFRRGVTELGFRGLKIYPKIGFSPDHKVLMGEVYPLCIEHDIPVMTHCSRGGVYRRGWSQAQLDAVTDPQAYIPVMRAFPRLRICLAHFGGDKDWRDYLRLGLDPDDPAARQKNWVPLIADMIRSGDYPGLWTDISYTIFKFTEYMPLLRLYLEDERIRRRVLFGSDFYMTRQQRLSEKEVSIRLRDAIGESFFRQIAQINPAVWLGEVPVRN